MTERTITEGTNQTTHESSHPESIVKHSVSGAVSSTTQFMKSGTLPKPGPLGRLIRLAMGIAIVFWLIPSLFQAFTSLRDSTVVPTHFGLWIAIVIGFMNLHHVVNLGLGRNRGHRPQMALIVLVLIALGLDYALYDRLWAPPLGLVVFVWLLLEFLPLGIAFLLSAVLATPGCEMRSYNHLFAILQGQDPTEHYCPGGIDIADRWEAKLKGGIHE